MEGNLCKTSARLSAFECVKSKDMSTHKSRKRESSTSTSNYSNNDSDGPYSSKSKRKKKHHEKANIHKHKKQKHKIKKKKSKTYDSDSSSSDKKKRKKEKKRKKKKKLKKEKLESSLESAKIREKFNQTSCVQQKDDGPKPSVRTMQPMTKEMWEKQQSTIKRVYDPETGRNRLVRGDGEIIEEIVSKERHKEINKQATMGDGLYYQSRMGLLK